MYYLLFIWGSVEPELQGPFMDFDVLLRHAREIWLKEGDSHGYFILHKLDKKISVASFGEGVLECS